MYISQTVKKSFQIVGRLIFIKILAVFLVTIGVHATVSAKTFSVDSVLDQVDANIDDGICASSSGVCSLRAAIQQANQMGGPDHIQLGSGRYMLSILGSGEDLSQTGDLDILEDITISGVSEAETLIDANFIDRVFHVFNAYQVTFKNLSIVNGLVASGDGGAMRVNSKADVAGIIPRIQLINVTIKNSKATLGDGGAIYMASNAILDVQQSQFTKNLANNGGAIYAIDGQIKIKQSTLITNSASMSGGGINSQNSLVSENTIYRNNTAAINGGAIFATGKIFVKGGVIDLNKSDTGAGIRLLSPETAYLSSIDINNNIAQKSGGGIDVFDQYGLGRTVFTKLKLTANRAAVGAAISGSNITAIHQSTITGNIASSRGGGLALTNDTIRTRIDHSLIANNTAYNLGAGSFKNAYGGAAFLSGSYTIENVTISNNKAQALLGTTVGGGILFRGLSTDISRITNTTIAFNESAGSSSNLSNAYSRGSLTVVNTIISNPRLSSNCDGTFISRGGNLDSDASCSLSAATDISSVDAALGALLDNGGGIPTLSLLVNSPAINQGDVTQCPKLDQRFFVRTDGLCDMGAYEAAAIPKTTDSIIFDAVNIQAIEGDASVILRLNRLGSGQGPVSVDLVSLDDSAISTGSLADYQYINKTVSWGDGDLLTKTVSINLRNDTRFEATESFQLVMSNIQGGAVLDAKAVAIVHIIDDDTQRSIAMNFVQAQKITLENAKTLLINVEKTSLYAAANVSIDYVVSGNSAVSGRDFTLANGTLLFAPNVIRQSIELAIIDDAYFEANETLTIRLIDPNNIFTIDPLLQQVTVTIIDDELQPAQGKINFALNRHIVTEGDPAVSLEIVRTGGTRGAVLVGLNTLGGSAIAGEDYTLSASEIAFNDGQNRATVTLSIIDDSVVELQEYTSFTLSVLEGGGAAVGLQSKASLQINDNDAPPTGQRGSLQFKTPQLVVAENGNVITIEVERLQGTFGSVSVDYSVTGGTATNLVDYIVASGKLVFLDGEVLKTFTIKIIDDTLKEPLETLILGLSKPSNGASLGINRTATISITDNDQVVLPSDNVVQFVQASYKVTEGDGGIWIELSRMFGTETIASVDYVIASTSTATVDADYILVSGTMRFFAGQRLNRIAIPIFDDFDVEPTETIILQLVNPSLGTVIGNNASTTISILDNDVPF